MAGEVVCLNFDLLINKEGAEFVARVTGSPTGEASTRFPAPLEAFEAQNLRLMIVRSRGAIRGIDARSATLARDIGERLFRGAFREDVLASYTSSLRLAEQQNAKLRIRLRLTDAESAQLPWEYTRDPSSGGNFIALDLDTPLVRYMEVPKPAPRLHVEGPLRILAVISAPTDREGLNAETEWANLQRALAPLVQSGRVDLKRLSSSTFSALESELLREDHHIFHFIGHGGYDPQTQDGMLVFTKDDGTSSVIASDQLGAILGDENSLQLAVINACEGAVSEGKDIFAGTAQRLVGHGVPAVVAMQAEITDDAALAFSERFYEALAGGHPVDEALVRARKAIFTQPNLLEWATPVLYMRSGDGQLFDVAPAAVSAPAPAVERPVAASPAPQAVPVAASPAPQAVTVAAATADPLPAASVTAVPMAVPAAALAPALAGAAPVASAALPIPMSVPMVPPILRDNRWRLFVAGVGFALLVVLMLPGLLRQGDQPPDAELGPAAAAEQVVSELITELEQVDYYDAWLLLSESFRAQLPYPAFADRYTNVNEIWFDFRDSTVLDPTLVRVTGKLTMVGPGPDGGELEVEYGGSYYVRQVSGRWYVDNADFVETRRTNR